MSWRINAMFTSDGMPTEGLLPTVKVRDAGSGALAVDSDGMTELGDGFYTYVFSEADGYDAARDYVALCDGGAALAAAERWVVAGSTGLSALGASMTSLSADIASMSTAVTGVNADVNSVDGAVSDVQNAVGAISAEVEALRGIVLAYNRANAELDAATHQLVLRDPETGGELIRWNLYGESGAPSVIDVRRREAT